MSILVHLTAEKNVKRILQSGIHKGKYGVYCLPVLPNYFISHQWLRELKRGGQRTFVGIYFHVPDDEMVLFGHYNKPHTNITVAEATRILYQQSDTQGYEMILMRTIEPNELHKIQAVPQVMGWRYSPDAHQRQWCNCPVCVSRGEFNSRKKRRSLEGCVLTYDEILASLHAFDEEYRQNDEYDEDNDFQINNLLFELIHRKAGQALDLAFLIDYPSIDVLEVLIDVFSMYKGKEAQQLLQQTNERIQSLK
jgi:hypothetical protein